MVPEQHADAAVSNKGNEIAMTPKEIEIEVEGKTTAEAIKKALKQLNVKREDVKIDIVCEEQKGLFGMEGAKMAKVRVSLINKP